MDLGYRWDYKTQNWKMTKGIWCAESNTIEGQRQKPQLLLRRLKTLVALKFCLRELPSCNTGRIESTTCR